MELLICRLQPNTFLNGYKQPVGSNIWIQRYSHGASSFNTDRSLSEITEMLIVMLQLGLDLNLCTSNSELTIHLPIVDTT